MDEGVDGLILENLTDRIDTVEKDVESYLDNIYELDDKIDTVYSQTNNIRLRDIPTLKLALTMIFLLGIANLIVLLLVVFQVGS